MTACKHATASGHMCVCVCVCKYNYYILTSYSVEEHEVLKIGYLTALPFLRHVRVSHQLPGRHHGRASESLLFNGEVTSIHIIISQRDKNEYIKIINYFTHT